MDDKGAFLVSQALLGRESETVIVGGRPYFIKPPTIRKIAGAGYALSGSEGDTMENILTAMQDLSKAAKALSWLIQGDEGLAEDFMDCEPKEVIDALGVAVGKIGIEDFQRLSGLRRSVLRLIANPK